MIDNAKSSGLRLRVRALQKKAPELSREAIKKAHTRFTDRLSAIAFY